MLCQFENGCSLNYSQETSGIDKTVGLNACGDQELIDSLPQFPPMQGAFQEFLDTGIFDALGTSAAERESSTKIEFHVLHVPGECATLFLVIATAGCIPCPSDMQAPASSIRKVAYVKSGFQLTSLTHFYNGANDRMTGPDN